MAKRIQRKRTKGWRMPEGAVYVGRPTRWGNPFVCENDPEYALAAFRRYVTHVLDWSVDFGFIGPSEARHKGSLPMEVRLGLTYSKGENNGRDRPFLFRAFPGFSKPLKMVQCPNLIGLGKLIRGLRGKDLACWCPLDAPCHADILLELANK